MLLTFLQQFILLNQKQIKGFSQKKFLKIDFDAKNTDDIYLHSKIGISFKEGNTLNDEVGFDSKKYEIGESDLYFKFQNSTNNLVIAGVGEVVDDLEIPFTVKIDSDDDVYIMIDEKLNIDRDVFIKDAVTNTIFETDNPIKLDLVNGTYEDRFFLLFGKSNSSDDNNSDDETEEETTVVEAGFSYFHNFNQRKLIITNKYSKYVEKVTLYNLLGQKVVELDENSINNGKEISINTTKIATAIYILNIKTKDGFISEKIAL